MNRLARLTLLPLVALAACGTGTDVIDAGQAPSTTAPRPPAAEPTGAQSGIPAMVWFAGPDGLVPAERTVADSGDPELAAAEAVRALLAGPSQGERAAGLTTAIPAGTRLLGFEVGDDRIATVDLSGEFQTGGGSASMRTRLGQLACTVDGLVAPDIADGTLLQLDGQPVEVFSGEGLILDDAITCADFHDRPTSGEAVDGCVDGWTAPQPGDRLRTEGLDLLRASLGTTGRFVVEDIRHFTGPDSPGILEPSLDQVDRWYVKAHLEEDADVRGRFLIVRRGQSGGVEAVAPFNTKGFESPDWAAFEGEGVPVAYPDLPGRWSGVRYDFVTGAGGPGNAGLPDEVEGCVADS